MKPVSTRKVLVTTLLLLSLATFSTTVNGETSDDAYSDGSSDVACRTSGAGCGRGHVEDEETDSGLMLNLSSPFLYRHARQAGQPGYRLTHGRIYYVTASKYVRPTQVYKVHFELLYMPYRTLEVNAVLIQDNKEYATSNTVFADIGSRIIELKVPLSVSHGQHKLRVTGVDNATTGQEIFRNETSLIFDSKYVSLFIETDKPVYYSRQQVYLKITGVTRDMKPASGSMTIYIADGKGNVILRKREQQLKFGIYMTNFKLDHPFNVGNFSVIVDAFGSTYRHNFSAMWYYRRLYELNMTCPEHLLDSEWGVTCIIFGQHATDIYSEGNATVIMRARYLNGTLLTGNITRHLRYVTGPTSIDFLMTEIESQWPNLFTPGKELYMEMQFRDWYFWITRTYVTAIKCIVDGYTLRQLGRLQRAFKPEIPFTIYYALQRHDGRPFTSDVNRQVTIQRSHIGTVTTTVEEKLLVPDDAILRYKVTPFKDDKRIIVRAYHCLTPSYIVESIAYRFYSRYDKYISVTTASEYVYVNEYAVITIRANFIIPKVTYVISANGVIYQSSQHVIQAQQKTFPIAVSREMAPRCRILVYTYMDGEFLVDVINLFVFDTILEAVYIKENWGKNVRRDVMELLVEGEPGGFISFSGLDWELYKRNRNMLLNREMVTSEIESYDKPSEGPFHHIWWTDDTFEHSVFFNAPSAGLDLNTTYQLGGFVALSDQNLTLPEEFDQCNVTLGYGRCLDGSCYMLTKKCDGIVDCADGLDEAACPPRPTELPVRRPHDLKYFITGSGDSQFYDMVAWAWAASYIQPNGRVQVPLNVPKSNVTFTIGAVAMHPVVGLQIVRDPIRMDTTRSFYMKAEAPARMKRGEQLGVRMALHNNRDEGIECLVMLHKSDDYRFIAVEDFGIVNSYSPRLISGDIQTMVEMRPYEQKYIFMPIVPIVLPETVIKVKVSAYNYLDMDTQTLNIELLYEGAQSDDFVVFLIDLVSQGSILLPYFDSGIPQNYWDPTKRELVYVPGSNTVVASVYGDVVSPGFFEPYLTTDNTNGLSDICGEGLMYDVAINLEVLKFLQSVNSLSAADAKTATDFMQWGLSRPYSYMKEDGSFKEFRRTEIPCVWITAFCFATMDGVASSEWAEEVYVPADLLNKVARWLLSTQRPDGAFIETSTYIYNRLFLPNTTSTDGNVYTWHLALTAYTTIALAESSRLSGDVKATAQHAVLRAGEYLAFKVSLITDPWQMAVVAYALHVAGHKGKDTAYEKLKTMKRDDGQYVYWSTNEIPQNEVIVIDTLQYLQRRLELPNEQNALMATSYALLLYLYHNEFEAARPIMKWIHTQHMGIMKYSSTIDGVLVMRALREFSYRETNRAFYSIEVTFEAGGDPSWKHVAMVNYTNMGILQQFTLNNAWGPIKVSARGTGYAYTELQVLINHEKPYQTEDWGPSEKYFDYEILKWEEHGYNATSVYVYACLKWLAVDIAPESGLVTMWITIPTGYQVPREVLEYMYAAMPRCRQIRYRDQQLIIFFDYLDATGYCFDYMMYRQHAIANGSIPQLLSVYEYAETGLLYSSIFTTYSLFHLHVCHVCGSFQCPYCGKYYNSAPPSASLASASLACLLILSILILMLVNTRWRRS